MSIKRTLWDFLDNSPAPPAVADSTDEDVEGVYFEQARTRTRWRVGITAALALGALLVLIAIGGYFVSSMNTPAIVLPEPDSSGVDMAGNSQPGGDRPTSQVTVHVVVALSAPTGCEQCLSGLFIGDLGEKPQRILHGRHELASVDVVKVSHHGSADQFVGLYQTLRARVGLVGVGADNTYGHPTTRALDILRTSGTTVFRSDLHGMVALGRNPGGKLVVWSTKSAMPR